MFDGLDDAYPLTPLQQGILYETLKNPDSDLYTAYILIDIEGAVNTDDLYRAWQSTALCYSALRTRFVWDGLDEPLQLVQTDIDLIWQESPPLTGSAAISNAGELVNHWLEVERQTPLSLTAAPPMRFRLVTVPDGQRVLIWTVHHLLADDWSTPVVLERVAAFSGQPGHAATDEALSYADYAAWLVERDQRDAQQWWQQHLARAEISPIALQRSTAADSALSGKRHHQHHWTMDERQSEAARQLAHATGSTLSVIFHAAWSLVLARYTGRDAVLFGTSVSGRSCDLAGIEQAVGLFLNTLPTWVTLNPGHSVRLWLEQLTAQLFKQIEHEHLPLSSLTDLLTDRHRQALFETVLVIETHSPDIGFELPGGAGRLSNIRYVTQSNYPLSILVFPGELLKLQLVSDPQHFPDALVKTIGDELQAVIQDLCAFSHADIASVQAAQEHRIRAAYPSLKTAPFAGFDSISDWLANVVESQPTKTALIDRNRPVTYQSLFDAAQALAATLDEYLALPTSTDQDITRSSALCIGIAVGRGFEQLAAVCAVLLHGSSYVPLDPAWPSSRKAQIAAEVSLALVIGDEEPAETNAEYPCAVLNVHTALQAALSGSQALQAQRLCPGPRAKDELAYILFTSGSTGRPKGVPVSHANLMYSTAARLQRYADKPECFLLQSPLSFDSSVAGIYWTLLSGGTLVLAGGDEAQDIHHLAEQIARHQVTHTLCLPSVYALLLQYAAASQLQSLRCVIVAGEVCPAALIKEHQRVLPQARLFNEYGPTEATVWATVAELTDADTRSLDRVPIGQAIPGSLVRIVDTRGNTLPAGVPGELEIQGPGVVSGYAGNEALTERQFSGPHALQGNLANGDQSYASGEVMAYRSGDCAVLGHDGQLYYAGRMDRQIKLRGQRLEPGEIENRLLQDPRVQAAYCSTFTFTGSASEQPADKSLICFYTLSGRSAESTQICSLLNNMADQAQVSDIEQAARRIIAEELPPVFSSVRLQALTAMPHLPNGKIDPGGLQALFESMSRSTATNVSVTQATASLSGRTTSLPPEAACASTSELCRILACVLNLDRVLPSDNYFQVGGDSLMAIRFVAACREQGLNLTIPLLNQYDDMASLGAVLDQPDQQQQVEPVHADCGETPLTPLQSWFLTHNSAVAACWNMAFTVKPEHPVAVENAEQAVRSVLERHRVLFSRFEKVDGQWKATIPESLDARVLLYRQSDERLSPLQHIAELQKDFSLKHGRLLAVSLRCDAQGLCHSLTLVIHHLVTDAVSNWHLANAIMEQMVVADGKSNHGAQTSFRAWAIECSKKHGPGSDSARRPDSPGYSAVSDLKSTWPTWRESEVVEYRVPVSDKLTQALQKHAKHLHAELHEWVLFSLLKSLNYTGRIACDIETHGRQDDQAGDISASVGWFTAFVRTEFNKQADQGSFADFLNHYREQKTGDSALRRTVNAEQGSEAGTDGTIQADRAIQSDSALSDQSTFPVVLYNFLAMTQIERAAQDQHYEFQALIDNRLRHPDSVRTHAIELIVSNEADSLEILWRVDKTIAECFDLSSWPEVFEQSLNELSFNEDDTLAESLSEAFPDSGLTDSELDDLLSSLE